MTQEKAGRKGRKRAALPKIFQSYFRRRLNGKDTWVSLGTNDPAEAKKELAKLVDSHLSVGALSKVEQAAQRLAEVFVESVTGKRAEGLPLAEAHEKW